MAHNVPLHPHSKRQSPWFSMCSDKLRAFTNRVNHVQYDLQATSHIKTSRGSYKCYIWLCRENYSPLKMKFRIRYENDLDVLDSTLNALFESLKPKNYIDQDEISTEVCSSPSTGGERSPDVF